MMKKLYLGLKPPQSDDIVHYPVIRIIPRPFPIAILNSISSFSHIIFTSKTAVEILSEHIVVNPNTKIFAVGQATAAAARQHGFSVTGIATEETAEGVVDLLGHHDLINAHLLWPHSSRARTVITDYLQNNGIPYTNVAIYDIELIQPSPPPNLDEFHEVIFTSPSTIDGFLAIYNSLPSHLKVTCQGPVTAAYLEKVNLKP